MIIVSIQQKYMIYIYFFKYKWYDVKSVQYKISKYHNILCNVVRYNIDMINIVIIYICEHLHFYGQ